jgi:hypothetical protein
VPKFLENRLRDEYGDNDNAIYGTMNKIGAMKGNQETEKGREMERKHESDVKRGKFGEPKPERKRKRFIGEE